jgi:ring-1,2-phenylacetyl-CoA epoxidase subunit PaaE
MDCPKIHFLELFLSGKKIGTVNMLQPNFLQWRIARIVWETSDSASFFLSNEDKMPVEYHAGQFLTLIFDRKGRELRRSYSFSSSPEVEKEVAFTVKRIPNGEISRYLLDYKKPGDSIRSLPPAGRFTLEPEKAYKKQIFLIAAGVGISPEFSILKKLLYDEVDCKLVLIFQNRDEEHVIFKSALKELEQQFGKNFRWINILSRPKENPGGGEYLTNALLEKIVNAQQSPNREKIFFLCGLLP